MKMSTERIRMRSVTKAMGGSDGNSEILEAMKKQQEVYLQKLEESKLFYVSAMEACEQRITAKIDAVSTRVGVCENRLNTAEGKDCWFGGGEGAVPK